MRDKIYVLNELKKNNNNFQLVAEKTGFDKETIRKWAQQKNKISSAPNKAKKRRGGGAVGTSTNKTVQQVKQSAKPPVYTMTVEEKLYECYIKYREAGHYVTVGRLRDLTNQIINENDLQDFKYSPEWLRSWMGTYELGLHKAESSESSSPVGLSDSDEREERRQKSIEKQARRKQSELNKDILETDDYIFKTDEIETVQVLLRFIRGKT